jgi:hypothetical protein
MNRIYTRVFLGVSATDASTFEYNIEERGVKMNLRRSEKQICLVLPEPCVEISGIHMEPGRIGHSFHEGCVKLWDQWKVQIMYRNVGEDGADTEKWFQETVLWEDEFPVEQPVGTPAYQTKPYCVKIAVSRGTESCARLTLSAVAVTTFGPEDAKASERLMGNALKRLGLRA